MRARRTPPAARDDYDAFDLPPPEVFDAPADMPIDEPPPDNTTSAGPSITTPARVCLVCGDDPAFDAGCPHDEVATLTSLDAVTRAQLGELRALHDSLRAQQRGLRRVVGDAVARGWATVEVREPPVVPTRVVLIPPPSAVKRPRRALADGGLQGRFGFVEVVAPAVDPDVNR